ncbi:hypothetical protein CMUS01_08446 [Colletotrichum musicola]|uniref:Uncharacterized protein n=1 Tax=Colletotrichum musicola TaxID=2175873 RepID=A0A8H6NCQ8_9PEZI|nr:hypothetical protein CMUS01_08446 [Colletotrichum musicola]
MGPAGLAAAARLKGTCIHFTIIDGGKAVQNRDRHLSLDARLKLVHDMVADIDGAVMNECNVQSATYHPDTDSFTVVVEHRAIGKTTCLTANRLLTAAGRFGPLEASLRDMTAHHHFRRLEVGFRIQQRSERAFFRPCRSSTPSCAYARPTAAWNGTNGLWTVSGRSDCPPTGRSNSGFNTRILNEQLARESLDHVLAAMTRPEAHFELPAQGLLHGDAEVVAALEGVYSAELVGKMAEGLWRLADTYGDLGNDEEATLIGPTLEGVGWYPKVDGNLRLLDAPVWVVGDACGLFRGIVAAMVSGHYAATSAMEELVHGAEVGLAALADQTTIEVAMSYAKLCLGKLPAAIA